MIRIEADDEATSPFAPFLVAVAGSLPSAFREQFLLPADATWRVLLEGSMDRVWHGPHWLEAILRLLAHWDVLYPETGAAVPTRMLIAGGRDSRGRAVHLWRRTFAFDPERRIDAELAYEPDLGRIVEWMGPCNSLEMAWRPRFLPPDRSRSVPSSRRSGSAGCGCRCPGFSASARAPSTPPSPKTRFAATSSSATR